MKKKILVGIIALVFISLGFIIGYLYWRIEGVNYSSLSLSGIVQEKSDNFLIIGTDLGAKGKDRVVKVFLTETTKIDRLTFSQENETYPFQPTPVLKEALKKGDKISVFIEIDSGGNIKAREILILL